MWVEPTTVANCERKARETRRYKKKEKRKKEEGRRKTTKMTALVDQVRFESFWACRFPQMEICGWQEAGLSPRLPLSALFSFSSLVRLIFPPRRAKKQWNAMQCSSCPATCALARQLKMMPTGKGAEQDPIGPYSIGPPYGVGASPFCQPTAALAHDSSRPPVIGTTGQSQVCPGQAGPSHCLCECRGIASCPLLRQIAAEYDDKEGVKVA